MENIDYKNFKFFIQVNIGGEKQKSGLSPSHLKDFLRWGGFLGANDWGNFGKWIKHPNANIDKKPSHMYRDKEITERCILILLNEAVWALEEGIIENVNDGDIGGVFGIGFLPWSGGPFSYMNQIGISNVNFGKYRRINGHVVGGTSLAEYCLLYTSPSPRDS